MTGGRRLDEGRGAFERGDWPTARQALADADGRSPLESDDLERLATAAYLTGHDDQSARAWTRAHQARLRAGDPAAAVRCLFWLGFGFVQRGEMAQGGGWLARASTLVEEQALDCAEAGYLLVPAALMAMGDGQHDRAHDLCAEAGLAGRRFGDPDLQAFSRLGRGQALLELGQADDGLRLFDEAMVAIAAGELSPMVAGIVFCAVIDACHQVLDVGRAREWTAALSGWCDEQPGLVPYRGQCLVHRSQVLHLQGAWPEAFQEATLARDHLARPPHPALGMAYYQLGELHRLRGEVAEAEEAFRCANESGRSPHPGLALLRLGQGRTRTAAAAIERALGEEHGGATKAHLLPAAVEIFLAAGRVGDARHAVDQLVELASATDMEYLDAATAHCRGALALADGDPSAAVAMLGGACAIWRALDTPYEAARTRMLLAAASDAVGDHEGAALERAAARKTFAQLGAPPAPPHAGALPAITARETDVLQLVAAGCTNRQIAERLVISEKTVERHLSNLFTKLGVSNRAAATAYAYDHGLV